MAARPAPPTRTRTWPAWGGDEDEDATVVFGVAY
jgi:hypothetical protein